MAEAKSETSRSTAVSPGTVDNIVICYRQLVPSNWEALKAIGVASLPQVYPDDYWQWLTATDGNHYTLGAFFGEELIGAVALVKNTKESYLVRNLKNEEARLLNTYEKVSYISTMIVAEKARRRGVATNLMRTAMDKLETEGTEAFYLHVMVGNEQAIKLYQKMGFRCEQHFPKYYDQPCLVADAYLYVRHVTPVQKCFCNWSCAIL